MLEKLLNIFRPEEGQTVERPEVDLTDHELIAAELFFRNGEEIEGVEIVSGAFEEDGQRFAGFASCTETGSVFLAGYLAAVHAYQRHYNEHLEQASGASEVPVRRAA